MQLGHKLRQVFVSKILPQARLRADWESVQRGLEASSGLSWDAYQQAISQAISSPGAPRATWGGTPGAQLICQHLRLGCMFRAQEGSPTRDESRLVRPVNVVPPGVGPISFGQGTIMT